MQTLTAPKKQGMVKEEYLAVCAGCKQSMIYDDGKPHGKDKNISYLLHKSRMVSVGFNKEQKVFCMICYISG